VSEITVHTGWISRVLAADIWDEGFEDGSDWVQALETRGIAAKPSNPYREEQNA